MVMMSSIFTFVYAACDLVAIGTGVEVVLGMLRGTLRCKITALFLRYALITNVIGLLFPIPDLLLTQKEQISMVSVYVSGVAILAWRKYDFIGLWRSIFALSTTIVLYLCVLAAIGQVFRHVTLFNALVLREFKSPIFVIHVVVTLFFVVLGTVATSRFHEKTAHVF
jgi:hypothetical protein